MSKVIAVCGTFDTKGEEFTYLVEKIRSLGFQAISVDMSIRKNSFMPTFPASAVAEAGGSTIEQIRSSGDPSLGFNIMSEGAGKIIADLVNRGAVGGVICMAGGRGTFMACRVLRKLPIGLPKVLISTAATCEGIQYYFSGINDTMVINPLVDISGLNPVLCSVMHQGAACICGMVEAGCSLEKTEDLPRVGITMWGVTTPCVDQVRHILEENGCEVLVFHANGMGGSIMDTLVSQGYFDVVADLTLSEITQPVCKNHLNDNNAVNRMMSACNMGVPQVVSFGGIDMIGHDPTDDPASYKTRKQYYHTAEYMFYRSNAEENDRCAAFVAEKLNHAKGNVTVVLPLRGTSAVNKEGEILYEPETNRVLVEAVHKYVKPEHRVIDVDAHINDEAFARVVATQILEYTSKKKQTVWR